MVGPQGDVPQSYPGPSDLPEGSLPAGRPAHRWGLGAYAVTEAVFIGSSLLLAWLFAQPGGGISVPGLLAAVAVPTLLAAGTAIAFTVWRGNGPRIDLGMQALPRDIAMGFGFGVGGLVLSVPAALIYVALVGPEEATSSVGEAFKGVQVAWPVAFLVFLLVAFVAPVCEEIIYRGLLWGAVERLGANRWVAFGITTLLFAMAHFELTRTPLLFVVSLPIGLVRALTGRLPAGIIAHQINNLLPGLALALALTGVVSGTG